MVPRLRLLILACVSVVLVATGLVLLDEPSGRRLGQASLTSGTTAAHSFRQATTAADWAAGTATAVAGADGTLRLASPRYTVSVGGVSYDRGTWTSGWVTPSHTFTELVPSWDASTPAGTFVTVRLRARTSDGRLSAWKSMGRWSSANSATLRQSTGVQDDGVTTVATDTVRAKTGVTLASYRISVQLHRRHGTTATPAVESLHAVASRLASALPDASKPLLPAKELAVPDYSQMVHEGEYPQYGGGGEAWCSPTALAMLLAYYGKRPTAAEYAWVDPDYPDRWVDEVARRTFDHTYDGTGNWPFNTAYAATRLPSAVVTRLRSLQDAEKFIARGIPLEVSISFGSGQLTGAPISSTPGHLVLVVGFETDGDVIVNDPAASRNAGVRRVYDRAQFEAAWLRKSHGLTYVMRDGTRSYPTGYGLS